MEEHKENSLYEKIKEKVELLLMQKKELQTSLAAKQQKIADLEEEVLMLRKRVGDFENEQNCVLVAEGLKETGLKELAIDKIDQMMQEIEGCIALVNDMQEKDQSQCVKEA